METENGINGLDGINGWLWLITRCLAASYKEEWHPALKTRENRTDANKKKFFQKTALNFHDTCDTLHDTSKIFRNFAAMKTCTGLFMALLLLTACTQKSHKPFVDDLMLPMTPVKNQGRSERCWAYAMLATIETEHLVRGDSVNLSAAWVESHLADEPAAPASHRGMGAILLAMIEKYGLVCYDAMRHADAPRPNRVFLFGVEYTPQEFARSMCAPGEYIALTSNSDSAYGRNIFIDEPDNWMHLRFLNVHIDTLLHRTERAVQQHHGVCWESKGHAMAIVGLAVDTVTSRRYFVMKNSWGENHGDRGLDYMSYRYFRKNTLAVTMTREAFGEQ